LQKSCQVNIFALDEKVTLEKAAPGTAKLELHLFCDWSAISSECAGSKLSQMLVADAGKGAVPAQGVVSLFFPSPYRST
jgi:hypothetical protein